MADKSDGDGILKTALGLGLLGTGQTQEHIQYNTISQVWVQVLQFVFLCIAIPITAAGLWLMSEPVAWLLTMATTTLDIVLAAVVIGVVTVGARTLARWLKEKIDLDLPAFAWTCLEVIGQIALIFLILELVHVAADENWDLQDSGKMVAGLGVTVAGALLSWRFANELFNPLFPKSPTTQILEQMVNRMDGGEPETVVEVRGPFPARANGQIAKPVMPTTQLPAGGGTVKVELSDDYKLFVDLVALVHRAQEHGLTRAANVENVHPRLRLPSGERLSRGRLEILWQYGADVWGLWTYEAERGITPEWLMEPDRALQVLKAAWEQHTGEKNDPPAPESM